MPPSASSNRPILRAGGPGEGALLVTEQLALDQRRGQGGAVDRDERRCRARWLVAWIARATSSLPVPVSPRYQDRRVGGGDLLGLEQHSPQDGALPDDVLEARGRERALAEILVFQLEAPAKGLQLRKLPRSLLWCSRRSRAPAKISATSPRRSRSDRGQVRSSRVVPNEKAPRRRSPATIGKPTVDFQGSGLPKLGLARGLRREVAQSGDDHRHALLGELLVGPRPGLPEGCADRKGRHPRSGNRHGGAQDAVGRIDQRKGRALHSEELDQAGEGVGDGGVEGLQG